MGKNRIIALAGRKESGKTELAKICENFGYIRISFASPLKNLVSKLLDITVDEINLLKKVKNNYILNEDKIQYLSIVSNISFDVLNNILKDKIFETTRDVLQFIGTDIIRRYKPTWHIDLIRESLEEDKKYCFDDLRFPNEKELIEELGGDCWFVVRPIITNVSNHISEISLFWQDFDKVIINDTSLSYLKFNWSMLFEIGYDESIKLRDKLYKEIENNGEINLKLFEKGINSSNFNLLDTLFISKYLFLTTNSIKYSQFKRIEQRNDKIVSLYYENDEIINISNPLLIENLKIYIN